MSRYTPKVKPDLKQGRFEFLPTKRLNELFDNIGRAAGTRVLGITESPVQECRPSVRYRAPGGEFVACFEVRLRQETKDEVEAVTRNLEAVYNSGLLKPTEEQVFVISDRLVCLSVSQQQPLRTYAWNGSAQWIESVIGSDVGCALVELLRQKHAEVTQTRDSAAMFSLFVESGSFDDTKQFLTDEFGWGNPDKIDTEPLSGEINGLSYFTR